MTKKYDTVQVKCINDDEFFDYDRYSVVDIEFVSSGIKVTTNNTGCKEVIFYPTHQIVEFWYTEE